MAVQAADDLAKRLNTQRQKQQASGKTATMAGLGGDGASASKPMGLGGGQQQTTDVSEIAADYMKDDSRIMKRAATTGLQTAASRGLLNSSLAVGAATGEIADRAIDMATTTSEQRWQSGENTLDRTHEFALQDDNQTWQSGENTLDRTHESTLQSDNQKWQSGEYALDRTHDTTLQDDAQEFTASESDLDRKQEWNLQNDNQSWQSGEYNKDRTHESSLQEDQQSWEGNQNFKDRKTQKTIAGWELDERDARAAEAMIESYESRYQEQYSAIMANTDLDSEARTGLLEAAADKLQLGQETIEALFDMEIDWGSGSYSSVKGKTNKNGKATGNNKNKKDNTSDTPNDSSSSSSSSSTPSDLYRNGMKQVWMGDD